jgi:hypothetical protein
MAPRGKPFTKDDPRAAKGRANGGRPKKSVTWKEAEEALREALPRVLLMSKNELQQILASNPTGAEMLAAKYIHEHVPQSVDKFIGKTPVVFTGAEGKPLIPAANAAPLPPIDFSNWSPEMLKDFIAAMKKA